jgi:predicted XRE-type DNA-binding protein
MGNKSITYKSCYGEARKGKTHEPSHKYTLTLYGPTEAPTHFEIIGDVYDRRFFDEEWYWHISGDVTEITEDVSKKVTEVLTLTVRKAELKQSKMDTGVDLYQSSVLAVITEKEIQPPCDEEYRSDCLFCDSCSKYTLDGIDDVTRDRKYSNW